MKRICVEAHWVCPELEEIRAEWAARTGIKPSVDRSKKASVPAMLRDFEKYRLPLMDEFGIALQVFSASSPAVQGMADPVAAVAAARAINELQAGIIAKYPGRFAGFATLPTQNPKAAAAELEYAVTGLGLKGAMIQGHTNGEYLDGQKCWPIWEKAEALGVPIYLHIAEPLPDQTAIYRGHPELCGPIWSWGVETATHALRIIGAGVFDAFPRATLILGHLGESLPYLLGRLDEGYAMAFRNTELKQDFSQYVRENIVITTSGKYQPEALVCAINALGADRILFAVDYPWVSPAEALECLERTPMSQQDRENISFRNAERLLKL